MNTWHKHIIFLSILVCASIGCNYPTATPSQHFGIDSGLATGVSMIWKVPRVGHFGPFAQPILVHDTLYEIDEHTLHCLNALDGTIYWQADMGPRILCASVENFFIGDGRLYIADTYGVVCMDARSGTKIWSLDPPPGIQGGGFQEVYLNSYAQSPDAIFMCSHNGGDLYKISKSDGKIIWMKSGGLLTDTRYYEIDPTSNVTHCPTYSNGRVYLPGRYSTSVLNQSAISHDGSIACFDAITGELLWINLIPPMDPKYSPYATDEATTNEYSNQEAFANIIIVNDTLIFKSGNSLTWMDRDGNILFRCGDPTKHGLTNRPVQLRYWQDKVIALDVKNGMPKCYGIDPISHQFYWTATISENADDYHSYLICPPPSVSGDIMYFFSDDDWIIGINTISGVRTYAIDLNEALRDTSNENQIMEGGFLVDETHHMYVMDNKYIYGLLMKQ